MNEVTPQPDPGKPRPKGASHLYEGSEDRVVLHPNNQDLFVRSQREVVEACRAKDDFVQKSGELRDLFDRMLSEIEVWSEGQDGVATTVVAPRITDLLVIVIATDEDETAALDDAISKLDLAISDRYPFRVTFLMLRAKEREGIEAFADERLRRILFDRAIRKAS